MSAFSLGSIRAVLGLDESNYVRGMLNAGAANEIFGSGVTNFVNNPLLGTIRIFKDVAAGTAATVRETAFLNQEYLRTAERIGVSTRTISGLQMAYRDMGLQAQEFEKQLTKLSIKVDEASQGNETSARLFQRLGVQVTDAAGQLRPLDDILRDVSDGLAGLSSQQEKVAIGNLLFGESFVKVLQIIGDGGRVIEDLIEKSSRYGQVVEDDAARASNELASALGDLGFAVDGARKRLATRFITSFIDEFAGGPAAVDALAGSIGRLEPAASKAGAALGAWVADSVEGLGIIIEHYETIKTQLDEIEAKKRAALDNQGQVDAALNERSFGSHPLSYRIYNAELDSFLFSHGSSREAVRRAARGHYPDEIEEDLAILHRNQERMRSLRARR